MTGLQLAQLAAALVAVITPWIVVRVAESVASRFAQRVQQSMRSPASIGRVGRATLLALPPAVLLSLWLPAPSRWMAFIDLAAFAALSTLALAALGDIDSASRALREVATPTRMATLSPRRVSEHLPWRWRLVPHAIATAGLILIAWRLTMPVEGRRPFVPLMFVGAAAVFLWLYEVWITDVVTGPLVSERQEPSRSTFPSVPMLFTTEIVLVTYPLVVAHALLDANWETAGTWPAGIAVASAVPAIIGCALALSSNLSRRRYAAAE